MSIITNERLLLSSADVLTAYSTQMVYHVPTEKLVCLFAATDTTAASSTIRSKYVSSTGNISALADTGNPIVYTIKQPGGVEFGLGGVQDRLLFRSRTDYVASLTVDTNGMISNGEAAVQSDLLPQMLSDNVLCCMGGIFGVGVYAYIYSYSGGAISFTTSTQINNDTTSSNSDACFSVDKTTGDFVYLYRISSSPYTGKIIRGNIALNGTVSGVSTETTGLVSQTAPVMDAPSGASIITTRSDFSGTYKDSYCLLNDGNIFTPFSPWLGSAPECIRKVGTEYYIMRGTYNGTTNLTRIASNGDLIESTEIPNSVYLQKHENICYVPELQKVFLTYSRSGTWGVMLAEIDLSEAFWTNFIGQTEIT